MASSGYFNTTAYNATDGSRYIVFSWRETAQSVENNSTTISWELKGGGTTTQWVQARNIKLTIDGETVYSHPGTDTYVWLAKDSVFASGTYTLTHKGDGTRSFTAYAEAGIYNWAVNCKGSASFTLDTIARASQPSLVTWPETTQNIGEFGDTFSIHMNRKSDSFTHTVRYTYGDKSGTIARNVETGTTWVVPPGFMHDIPNATSGSGTIYVDTYNGSTFVGTKWTGFTATVPASVKPTCTVQVLDATNIQDTYGNLVKGLSKLYVKVNGYPAYSSPITAYAITANGTNYYKQEITTGFISAAGTTTITGKVTDKRGRVSDVKSASFPVIDYATPKVTNLNVGRCDEDGTANEDGEYVKVIFAGSVSPLNNKNSATYVLRYKKTEESAWEKSIPYTNLGYNGSGEYIFEADPEYSYSVQLEVIDDFPDKSAKRTVPVSTAFTLMDWHESGTGIGFGKISEKENTAQFSLDAEFLGNVYGKAKGLGSLPAIPSGANFNNYIDVGCFAVHSDDIAATISNMPIKTSGRLIVSASTGDEDGVNDTWVYREQLFLPHDMYYGKTSWIRAAYRRGTSDWEYGPWNSSALAAYPVNSIYISYSHVSPAELFGGEWTRISNAFLWGCDANGGIGTTGGEKTHTLTINELPVHSHGSVYSQNAEGTKSQAWYSTSGDKLAYGVVETGGGAAHNNMPPYIQVSIWRRTA